MTDGSEESKMTAPSEIPLSPMPELRRRQSEEVPKAEERPKKSKTTIGNIFEKKKKDKTPKSTSSTEGRTDDAENTASLDGRSKSPKNSLKAFTSRSSKWFKKPPTTKKEDEEPKPDEDAKAGMSAVFAEIKVSDPKGLKPRGDSRQEAGEPAKAAAVVSPKKTATRSKPRVPQTKPKVKKQAQPKFGLENDKDWLVSDHHKGGKEKPEPMIIEEPKMSHNLHLSRSDGVTVEVKKKINTAVLESCNNCNIVLANLISGVEVIRSTKCQIQVTGRIPSLVVDSSSSITVFLSRESLDVSIVTSKTSEVNVMYPKEEDPSDWHECVIPHQFVHTIDPETAKVTSAVSDLYR